MREPPKPSGALVEMLQRDGVLDDILSGRGLRFEPAQIIEAPTLIPEGMEAFRGIERVDWEQERLEREERERQARIAAAQALLEDEQPPERPTPPAAKRRKEAA